MASTSSRARAGACARVALGVATTLFGLLVVTFVVGRVVPIDPALAVVGDRASVETYQAARAAMGLDRPLPVQFWLYLEALAAGDLGTSVVTARPVIADIGRYFPATIELATTALLIGLLLGVPAGVIAATRRGRWPDHVVRLVSLLGYSMPAFWLGLVLLLVFYAELGWAAGPGRLEVYYEDLVTPVTGLLLIDAALDGEWVILGNAIAHMVLPAAVLGSFSMAYIARMTRAFMIEQLGQEYVLAARAKGLSEARVVWRHALGNAAVPLVTVVALSYGALLEGSVLTETVFAWPGLGSYLTNSLFNADMNAVLGCTIVIGLVFLGLNLLADLIYTLLDPRVR
jgi:peptide/nickel transport system permease protein